MEAGLSGAVLCGGSGRRMGADKADLVLGGERLLDRVVGRLSSVADPVLLAGGARRLQHPGCRSVLDPLPNRGPLGGLVAALTASPHHLCAVVGVDMPDLSPILLRLLADSWSGEHAVVPVSGSQPQPLHAVYSRDALTLAEAALSGSDLSLRHLLTHLRTRFVDAADLVDPEAAAICASSLNTPADVTRWLAARRDPP
jgi:molybdenum cofactor guanylyltransferase